MIAGQSGSNCIRRGFSTMRLALGYDIGIPKEKECLWGEQYASDILSYAKDFFPDHEVRVYCSEENAQKAADRSSWEGEYFNLNIDEWLVGFSYYVRDRDASHFVIGAPHLYEGMKASLIIAVRLKPFS